MRPWTAFAIGVVLAASVLGVGVWAQGRGDAEVRQRAPMFQAGDPVGPVITGADFGFQPVAGRPNTRGNVVGNLVVRVNGEWRTIEFPTVISR